MTGADHVFVQIIRQPYLAADGTEYFPDDVVPTTPVDADALIMSGRAKAYVPLPPARAGYARVIMTAEYIQVGAPRRRRGSVQDLPAAVAAGMVASGVAVYERDPGTLHIHLS